MRLLFRSAIGWLGATVLLTSLAGVACQKTASKTPNPTKAAPSPRIFAAEIRYNVPSPNLQEVPLERAREALAARRVLRPDRRLLGSVAELHAILGRKQPKLLIVSWKGNRWELELDGKMIGTLSSPPTFGETLALLTKEASELLSVTKVVRAAGNGIDRNDESFFGRADPQVAGDREAMARRKP